MGGQERRGGGDGERKEPQQHGRETPRVAATLPSQLPSPQGCRACFCAVRVLVTELHIAVRLEWLEFKNLRVWGGEQREQQLPLNWQKLELPNAGEMQEST